jgi:hypothetical protein
MNGARLGAYQCFTNSGLNRNPDGSISFTRSVAAGGIAGTIKFLIVLEKYYFL